MIPPHNTRRYMEEGKSNTTHPLKFFASRTRQAFAWRAYKFSDEAVNNMNSLS